MASIANKVVNPLLFSVSLGAITYAGACFALYSYQQKLIFRPIPDTIGTPAEIGFPYEDVWIPVKDSLGQDAGMLHGWWLPNPGSKQTMLFCHGNYGNISYNLKRICFHYDLGFSVLAFDYRGFGQSSGPDPTEQSTYADAEAAWRYLTVSREIAPEQITVMGHSMGGAIAIDLATRHPEMARLIVKSSFTSMQDVVEARPFYRLFPIEHLLTEPFDSLSKVGQLQVPVLYVHGGQDPDVPAEMSQRLYDASPTPKQLWFAVGADHNNISSLTGEAYSRVVSAFCKSNALTGLPQKRLETAVS
ncbi:MAG: alpha/beta fold hydrolase [Phormidesmis sp.]